MKKKIAFYRRDSEYGYSDDTIPENIYIFEVLTSMPFSPKIFEFDK